MPREVLNRILPRAYAAAIHGIDVRNWRTACRHCAELRRFCGNCPAAMAMVRLVVNPQQLLGAGHAMERRVALAWFGGIRPAKNYRPFFPTLPVWRWRSLARLRK